MRVELWSCVSTAVDKTKQRETYVCEWAINAPMRSILLLIATYELIVASCTIHRDEEEDENQIHGSALDEHIEYKQDSNAYFFL